MQFTKVTITAGQISDNVLVRPEELDGGRLSDCASTLIQLKSIIDDNLRIVATGNRNEIKRALQRDCSAVLPILSTGNALSISLGKNSMAIDNPGYKKDSDLHFNVWEHGSLLSANLVVPNWLSEISAKAHCFGTVSGSALRCLSDEDLATYSETEEARKALQVYRSAIVNEIIAIRPCVIIEATNSTHRSDLHDLAMSFSVHFAASMMLPQPA